MSKRLEVTYDQTIEAAIGEIMNSLQSQYVLSKRAIALLLLQEDEDILGMVKEKEKNQYFKISQIIEETKQAYNRPLNYIISLSRQKKVDAIAEKAMTKVQGKENRVADFLSRLTMNPLTGVPILLLVLYYGLYKFVGEFGAGTVVDFLEEHVFGVYINPLVNGVVQTYIPWTWLQDLLANDYGIITLGIRYAVAIILPIVGTFFLMFSIIEDSGYLPRLAMLVDRVFKKIGLNGRAVIPMTLGFGCDTMATMVSRTLETKRERVIATLLLALAIPCSAQLGVILALLSSAPGALGVWLGFVGLIFLLIGYLTTKILPGDKPSFYMEVPPLRLPKLSNVLTKTYTRMQWYFVEIVPLFILASILIWFGNLTGLFGVVIGWMQPVVNFIGLPDKAAEAFLFGFFRRDYGAAGLYDLQQAGVLSPRQLVVAAATLTLFVPCIAQFSMMLKERGVKTALAIAGFIFPFAFIAGFVLNWVLLTLKVLP
ncbi:Fe2+ transport system protein B [Desulfitobacterium dichloroeliminans LMG P-21439]|uniref:Fe2+ transport system protein B n=1 Tax=Desulfitobacterium dichloroeliminans (strain LMG P-21439 / DCA1) TaxID=871963 RepID=L0F784_DESDL|nr:MULTISPECIES: ferrous iron transporter B [Desulfitobacteriaceae]AGA68890.1 Fe2+ transport system protein B [Desulfitobacterium dichloroeliminans LMG P-21439]